MAEIASFGVNVDQNTRLAQNAQDTANTANGGVNNINDPNKLAPAEKATLKRKYDTDVLLYGMDTKKLTDNQLSTSEIDSAMNALTAYMTPFFANMTSTDTVDRDTLNTVYKNFDTADKDSDSAFTNMVSNTASDALSAGNQAKKAGSEAVVAGNQASEAANNAAAQASVAVSKANVAQSSVATAITKAGFASDVASVASQAANDAKTVASQAANNVAIAKNDASDAVATANSTASEFGKVSQKTDSAVASALDAQNDASDAVEQASSAATDSKDAKQIAGAVSQSYKTLTDGSTMTIAELESGLAVKLTKTDLDGYATQTWTQNQINTTADGINGTISSVKTTVDGHDTSINELKADSSGFKTQFTTVNDTLGKHTTDIGTLQASSKELTSRFNTLTTDNTTNKNDISQLKQTSTKLSSTMETVQTQVQNSAVGTNLYTDTKNFDNLASWYASSLWTKTTDTYNGLAVMQTTQDWNGLSQYTKVKKGDVLTYSAYAKYVSGTGTSTIYWGLNNSPEGSYSTATVNPVRNIVTITESWQRVSGTITATSDGYLRPRIERDVRNSNTLQIAGIKLEKGSLSTDWCPNPADNASVTAFSKLSQTVDGMQSDISKKIEQKDLNGYATQTWAQNQINTTADGINATISSVKNTVDSHTTDINTLQADSNGFKAQFDTVNDTLGKHTTDIGTLQASSKELTSRFNTLTTDNTTNKNDISQLKQTSTKLSSTMETVQTQVQNSAVGTNLYTGTQNFDNLASWWGSSHWAKTTDTYNGLAVMQTTGPWNGLSQYIQVKKGDVLTYSVYAKYASGTGTSTIYWGLNQSTEGSYSTATANPVHNIVTITESWQRVSGTITATSDGYLRPRIERDVQNSNTLQIAGIKLEKGSLSTDWCPNPADNATVTALTQVKQTAEGASQLSKDNHGNILALQSTAKGLQTSVSNAATKDQLNILSDTFSNKISSATNTANSKMIQTINNVGIGFKNPDGSKFQMNLSADGTALMDFSKIMLNGQTNIANGTIGNAQIANGAINQAKIANAAIGSAQIKDLAVTNAKIGNLDAGKITTGILDASHLNAGDVVANVINGKTITGITINTPTLNLGTNGTLTTSFNLNQATSLYAPKKGTGTLRIGTGVINARSDNMSRYSNTKGYWYGFDDNGSMVKNGTNHTGDDYAPGYEKHDIMKSNGNVLNRSYLDAMALALNEGGTKTFNTMLTAIGLETGNALLHQDLATEGTFEARLGTGNKYGFKIDRQVISPMIRANHYTYAADVFISRYGTMGLSTSTKVNKLDIADVPDMLQKGYNLLTLNPRQWFDKTSVEAYADVQAGNTDSVESVVDIKPVTGMVAEEVASAGLDDYVIKDENNKVQGLAYDRLWTLLLPVLRNMNDRLNEAQLEITKLKRGCLK